MLAFISTPYPLHLPPYFPVISQCLHQIGSGPGPAAEPMGGLALCAKDEPDSFVGLVEAHNGASLFSFLFFFLILLFAERIVRLCVL